MSHHRPDQGAEPTPAIPEIALIRAEMERLEAEISAPNPLQDGPSRAATLSKISKLLGQIKELEDAKHGRGV